MLTRARAKLRTSHALQQADAAAEPARLFWIRISNVHEKVAYEDIIRALFPRCVELRSKNANPSNLGGHFQDSTEVAFATKEEAKDAVIQFEDIIIMFQQRWKIKHCRPKSSLAASCPSSLKVSDIQQAPKSPDDALAEPEKMKQDADAGDAGKVTITYIDVRVPIDVVKPLFEIAGKVTSYKVLDNSSSFFRGPVKLEYEQRKDAVAAAELLDDNISFYGFIWDVKCDHSDEDANGDGDGDGDVDVVDADDDEDDDEGDDWGDNDDDDDKDDELDIDDELDSDDDDDGKTSDIEDA